MIITDNATMNMDFERFGSVDLKLGIKTVMDNFGSNCLVGRFHSYSIFIFQDGLDPPRFNLNYFL